MRAFRNVTRLFREFTAFSRESKSYWLIPLIIALGVAGLLVVAGQAAAPLIYTLF